MAGSSGIVDLDSDGGISDVIVGWNHCSCCNVLNYDVIEVHLNNFGVLACDCTPALINSDLSAGCSIDGSVCAISAFGSIGLILRTVLSWRWALVRLMSLATAAVTSDLSTARWGSRRVSSTSVSTPTSAATASTFSTLELSRGVSRLLFLGSGARCGGGGDSSRLGFHAQ
ncbi:hypothetical protein BC629DRAFT_1554703 [Irpex lacteus]|nr:hypothetical protein BC629DRAFT_1554703 [Irpex lacteus]